MRILGRAGRTCWNTLKGRLVKFQYVENLYYFIVMNGEVHVKLHCKIVSANKFGVYGNKLLCFHLYLELVQSYFGGFDKALSTLLSL